MAPPNDSTEVYLGCCKRLESEVTGMDQDATHTSIAISLKRIADILKWFQVGCAILYFSIVIWVVFR